MVPHRIVHNAPVLLEMKYNSYMKVCEGLLCMLGYQKGQKGKGFCIVGTNSKNVTKEICVYPEEEPKPTICDIVQHSFIHSFTKIGNL